MNILLFNACELSYTRQIKINDLRRQTHLAKVMKPKVGDTIRVGQINGAIGVGTVIAHNPLETLLEVTLNQASLAPVQTTTLAIGPEGGFTAFSLGPRMMRVETATPVAISRLWTL